MLDAQGGTEAAHSRRGSALVLPVIAILTAWAFLNRFILDDAFISFRYADHLARGVGLVWNPEERVEGYTNFLWTLAMALPHRAGFDPAAFSQGVGLALFAGTLAFAWRLARATLGSASTSMLAILLLGANATFSAYATSGLETQLQALLVTACLKLTPGIGRREVTPGALLVLSLVSAAALLTRLDSAIPVGVALVVAAHHVARSGPAAGRKFVFLILPLGLLVGTWMTWKLVYYGDLLPNTYYAKSPAVGVMRRGLRFLFEFLLRYGYVLVLPLALLQVRSLWARPPLAAMAAIALLWTTYVVGVGGDFMEFRLMVPVLPGIVILTVAVLAGLKRRAAAGALIAFLMIASFVHGATFRGVAGIESTRGLESHVLGAENWRGIGRELSRLFHADSVVIATSAAGAIPYFSRLPSIDMLGLCDRWVARQGHPVGSRGGHRRIATHRYLHERGVNLVLGHPVVAPGETPIREHYTVSDLADFWLVEIEPRILPAGARVLEIPMGAQTLAVLYLEPHPALERAIRTRGWVTHPVVRAQSR